MGMGIEDVRQICLECGQDCVNRRSLGNHVARSHKELKGLHGYMMKHVLKDVPKCMCGCDHQVEWHSKRYRFNDYVNGHNPAGYTKCSYKESTDVAQKRIQRIKDAYANNPDLKRKIAISVGQAFKDPVKKKNLSEGQKRGWDDQERKLRQAEHAIRLQEQGKIGPQAPFKTEWKLNPFTGREEWMQSSWETAFLNKCISEGYPVTKSHSLRIPYDDPQGVKRIYVPDFIALNEKVVFEIKGCVDEDALLKKDYLECWADLNGWETVMIDVCVET